MSNNQKLIAILAGRLMIFVGYVGYQEWSIATGEKVRLQSKPIDPNDFFRGDYVILGYDIDTACDLPMVDSGEKDETGKAIMNQQYHDERDMTGREKTMGGKLVYVPLIQSGDVMIASGCVSQKPTVLSIKGFRQNYNRTLFGIEKYFVQQGSGKPLEEARGTMKIQVSISKGGQARIVDYKLE